jgi:hypothetical protein
MGDVADQTLSDIDSRSVGATHIRSKFARIPVNNPI